jgi:flagellar protein FliL
MSETNPARIASMNRGQRIPGTSGKGGKSGADAVADKPKKSKKMKLLVLIALIVVGGGIGAKFTVLAPAAKASEPAKPAPGPVVTMDELTLNLDGGHFLRLKLSIETTKGTSAELELTEGVQAVIDEFSNRSVASLTGQKAREKAKEDLVKKLQKIYPKKVLDVYYTEFVMQ